MKHFVFGLLALSLFGCGDKTPEENEDTTSTTDSNSNDQGSDTDNSQPSSEEEEIYYLEPVAIGFEYIGNWDEEADALVDYIQPGELMQSGEDTSLFAVVEMSLASMDFFSMSSDDPDRDMEVCTMAALFFHQPATIVTEEYDWVNYGGGNGTIVAPWASYEGYLAILESSLSDRCYELDPAQWTDGTPVEVFNEMHFGISFGELSTYMSEQYAESAAEDPDFAEYWETAQYSYFTQYIAMNHPNADEPSGYDFIAYDWTTSLYIESDKDVCEDIVDEEGTVVETVCGKFVIEEGDTPGSYQYVFADVTDTTSDRFGYVSGSAWWYEDFPNLDLTLLKEGIPEMNSGE